MLVVTQVLFLSYGICSLGITVPFEHFSAGIVPTVNTVALSYRCFL
jgi:hypothetical protein